jgi:4-hydroxy-2-oxoglutarate aldolase
MARLNLNGVLPPVPTAFDDQGGLDLDGLARNIARYNETGLAGYVALGSNGEAVHLTADERARVIETIKRAAAPGMTIVAGVNELAPQAAIEATRRAAGLGVDAALVITPYYYKSSMTQEALARFYWEVGDASPVPVLIYNVPQNTGVVIESATIASLAEHPNIVGVKDSAGNIGAISETIRRSPEGFAVMAGNGGVFFPSLMMNASGAVLAVACAAPRACVELYSSVKSGNYARARELQNRIGPLSVAVTATFGVAGLKVAMELAGFVGGSPRSPLLPLGAAEVDRIKAVMRETGLFPAME